jgi:chitodextrinase
MWYKGTEQLYTLKNLCENGLVSYIEDTKGTDVGYPNQPPSRNMDIYWRQVLKLHSRVTYAATYGPDLDMIGNKAWDESFEMINRYAGLHNSPNSSSGAFIIFCNFSGVGNTLYTINNVSYFLTQSNSNTTNLTNYGTLTHPYGHSVKRLSGNTIELGLNTMFAGYIKNSKVQIRVTYHDQENDDWVLKINDGSNLVTLTESGTVDEGNNWKTAVFNLNNAVFPGNGINDLIIEKTGTVDPVFHKVEILLDGEPNRSGDINPPTAPSNLLAANISKNTVNLSWDPSFDAVGIAGYLVYKNDELAAEVSNTNTVLLSLNCGSNYSLSVRAKDEAGNISESSNIVNIETATCEYSDALYSENFDDNLAQDWLADSTDKWTVANNKYSTVRGGLYTSIYHGLKFKNYIYKVDAFPYFHNDFGVIFNFIDKQNYYIMILDADPKTARLVKVENGISSIVANSTYSIGGYQQNHNIVLKNSGTEVHVSVNGTVVFNNISITLSDSAKIGLWVERNPVDFDNIEVFVNAPVDNQAPTIPSDITTLSISENTINLSWTASTDNEGVAGYLVYKNDMLATISTSASVEINGLICDSMYTFHIVAVDLSANQSEISESSNIKTSECSDISPPSVPVNLSAANIKRNSLKLLWDPSIDNDMVLAYNIYIDEVFETAFSDTFATIYGLNCGTSYNLSVKARDKTGNLSDEASIHVSTAACPDNTPPTVPANIDVLSKSQTECTLIWNASEDDVGVIEYDVLKDGVYYNSTTDTTITISGLTCNQSYQFTVKAIDAAGNESELSSILNVTSSDCISNLNSLKNNNKEIQIYPIPFNNELNISFSEPIDDCIIYIYNSSGMMVYCEQVLNTRKATIQMNHNLPSGLYMLKFTINNRVFKNKVFKY